MNNIQKLEQIGQSIWYDNISRALIQSGGLKKLLDEGLLGVTSNPAIFDQAISGSEDYDDQIRQLLEQNPNIPTDELIQSLMVKDIQMATDVLRPVYERTQRRDGYVSVEVTPSKAHDTKATLEEVRVLWNVINRPNLMIKIPATEEGLPAIEQSIYEGININVTLIFSVERYAEVADTYIHGLERRARENKSVDHITSVASVFVSRIDKLLDDILHMKIDASAGKSGAEKARSLLGKIAIANTMIVYQTFKEKFQTERFKALENKGAHVQRPLWGSTGTKDPKYSDVLYVDSLIGPHTVNTVPPKTYSAFLDHGKPKPAIENNIAEARKLLQEVSGVGIDLKKIMKKLEDDGVASFEKSYKCLYHSLEEKRPALAPAAAPA